MVSMSIISRLRCEVEGIVLFPILVLYCIMLSYYEQKEQQQHA